MPPRVIDAAKADDPRDVVHRAVQALAEGELVALPTETVYGIAASATHSDAVARLADVRGSDASGPLTLAVKSAEDAEDYTPNWTSRARRLARRCWPGPVTLVVEANDDASLIKHLPASVLPHVCPEGVIELLSPANQLVQDILRMLAGPVALTSVKLSGEAEATTAKQCAEALGDDLSLVLDAGPSHYGQASTVVQIGSEGHQVLREGVVGRQTIDRLSRILVVFVCTGNTCRSPMAEALMRRHLAEQLGVADDELESRGVMVVSAGIAAASGSPASPETAEVLRQQGIACDDHAAQQLSAHLVRHADSMLAMTPSHVDAIVGHWPEAAGRVKLVSASGGAISDPIGGPLEVYQRCAEQISEGVVHHAKALLAELAPRA